MSCDNCGAQTPRSRLCAKCAREEHQESRDTDVEWYECTTEGCEFDAAAPDARCYHCRDGHDGCPACQADAPEIVDTDSVLEGVLD